MCPFSHELYKLVDSHQGCGEVPPCARVLDKPNQSLIDLGVNLPDLKARGYVVAVYRAANPAQSMLLDYTHSWRESGGGGVVEEGAKGVYKIPEEVMPSADYESPHTSLNDVVHSLTVRVIMMIVIMCAAVTPLPFV